VNFEERLMLFGSQLAILQHGCLLVLRQRDFPSLE
jgi:hypothetical protein